MIFSAFVSACQRSPAKPDFFDKLNRWILSNIQRFFVVTPPVPADNSGIGIRYALAGRLRLSSAFFSIRFRRISGMDCQPTRAPLPDILVMCHHHQRLALRVQLLENGHDPLRVLRVQ